MLYPFPQRLLSGRKFFKQKIITDSIILNKSKFFSKIVNKWHYPLKDYIISLGSY